MIVKIYNQNGEEVGKIELPPEIFDIKMNSDLVHQVTVSQMANRRQVSAQVKDRGEVRGGGRKPWAQKETGRARQGSRRSPIWRGGGVIFGPTKERNFKQRIPKKMRRKALFMALTQKLKDKELIVLEELKIEKPKTKDMANIIKAQSAKQEAQSAKRKAQNKDSVLIALPKMDRNVILGVRNIPKTATIQAKELNCLDVLKHKYLIMPKETIEIIKTTFKK